MNVKCTTTQMVYRVSNISSAQCVTLRPRAMCHAATSPEWSERALVRPSVASRPSGVLVTLLSEYLATLLRALGSGLRSGLRSGSAGALVKRWPDHDRVGVHCTKSQYLVNRAGGAIHMAFRKIELDPTAAEIRPTFAEVSCGPDPHLPQPRRQPQCFLCRDHF